ncbi:unnamed protein product [Anisakis simplex]|uniref:Uncharacterized protein n=1 Tax=Anisakis simplex TaxID=6269 RepID=A0A0M3J8L3_ANISI|nr:unnamed protein product [Anisakis simplex]
MSTADESCTPEESTSAGCSSFKRSVCSRHRKSQRSVQGGCAFFKRSHKNARSKRNQKSCDGLLSEECDGDIEILYENIKEPNPKKLKCQRNELFVGDCERNSSVRIDLYLLFSLFLVINN